MIIQPLKKKGQRMHPGAQLDIYRKATRRGGLGVNASALVAVKVRTQHRFRHFGPYLFRHGLDGLKVI